jgi:hypothetical protein
VRKKFISDDDDDNNNSNNTYIVMSRYQNAEQNNNVGIRVPNLPPSSAEVKECVELYLHSLNTPSWRGA